MTGNAFYAQSGGVTSVINATACGVIQTAREHGITVLAGRNGIIGALQEELIDTNQESAADIAALKHTPAGAFGSCRYKLKSINENRAQYQRLIDVFNAHDIRYFFYNGGGDSQDTAYKVSQLSETMGHPLPALVFRKPSITICRSPITAQALDRWRNTLPSPYAKPVLMLPRCVLPLLKYLLWK